MKTLIYGDIIINNSKYKGETEFSDMLQRQEAKFYYDQVVIKKIIVYLANNFFTSEFLSNMFAQTTNDTTCLTKTSTES